MVDPGRKSSPQAYTSPKCHDHLACRRPKHANEASSPSVKALRPQGQLGNHVGNRTGNRTGDLCAGVLEQPSDTRSESAWEKKRVLVPHVGLNSSRPTARPTLFKTASTPGTALIPVML